MVAYVLLFLMTNRFFIKGGGFDMKYVCYYGLIMEILSVSCIYAMERPDGRRMRHAQQQQPRMHHVQQQGVPMYYVQQQPPPPPVYYAQQADANPQPQSHFQQAQPMPQFRSPFPPAQANPYFQAPFQQDEAGRQRIGEAPRVYVYNAQPTQAVPEVIRPQRVPESSHDTQTDLDSATLNALEMQLQRLEAANAVLKSSLSRIILAASHLIKDLKRCNEQDHDLSDEERSKLMQQLRAYGEILKKYDVNEELLK
jgi:hypothetical protein